MTRKFEKTNHFLKKVAQTVSKAKRGQSVYNKAQFESPEHLHQTTFGNLKYLQQTMFLNCLFW